MIGQTISHYQIKKKIGEGAMGEVYLAHDLRLNRSVALKFLPETLAHDTSRMARFEREAQLLAALNHRNIAFIHDLEEHEGKSFLVMELAEGETLADRLRRGPLSIEDALKIALQIAEALNAAHVKGIIHRDLKPANIKVTLDGLVKVLDFGLAKQFLDPSMEVDTEASTLHAMTIDGAVLGTPAYMSPEQCMGETLDARSDIFSFGAILYEMLTGKRPCAGATVAALMQAILSTTPQSPRRLRPDVPVELDNIVMKSLEKKKQLRQQTADQLCSELAQFNATRTSRTSVLSLSPLQTFRDVAWHLRAWKREHKRGAVLAIVLLMLIVIGGLVTLVLKRRSVAVAGPGAVSNPLNSNASAYDLFQQGLALLERYDKEGNKEAAIQAFQSALSKDPKYAPAYAGLGAAYLSKYQSNRDKQLLDQALQNAKQAVDLDGHIAMNRVSLGRVYVEKGEYDLAEAELKQAMTLDPLNAAAHRAMGDLSVARKNVTEAERLYTKAIELRPNDWDLRYALGNFYFRSSRYAEAEKAFAEAIRLAPDSFMGYRNLGAVYHMQGRFGEASAEFQRALQIKPSASTYSNLGTSLFFQGLYQQAVTAMEKAIELGANNYQAWANLGDAYRWTPGNEQKAKEAYRSAIQMVSNELSSKPNDAEMRSRLGVYLAKSGEKQKALAEAEAVEGLDKSAPVLARLVLIYEICGQRRRALDTMAAALKAGYSIDEFRRDPELLELRNDPNFHKLVLELSNKPDN